MIGDTFGDIATPPLDNVALMLLGDSILSRNFDTSPIATGLPASGVTNWSNWLLGSPFVIEHTAGVSGDKLASILSRLGYIPPSVQAVAILGAINDVVALSSIANQAAIDAEYNSLSSKFLSAALALTAAGKKAVFYTIPPNNAINTPADSRIQLLDRLNAFIIGLASQSIFVADIFTGLVDAAQPTLRVFTASMTSDGTHLSNNGAFTAGTISKPAFASLYRSCLPNRNIYHGFQPQQVLYGSFRSGTGGTAPVKTAGTGNLADGWRSINNAGAATFTLDNTELYTPDPDMVGGWPAAPVGPENFWQLFSVSAAIANDNPRLRFVTSPTSAGNNIEGIFGGSEIFAEVEVSVSSAVNLREANLRLEAFFTNGTSPADQAYQGTTTLRAVAGIGTAFSITDAVAAPSYRMVLRTPIIRVPENVNMVSGISSLLSMDMIFAGAGSANVKFARPRLWHRSQGRFG